MLGQGAVILPLLLAQAAPAATSPASGDVVITAERLRKLRLAASVEDGRLFACAVRVTSGDAAIDRIACDMMRDCAASGVVASEPLADCVDTRIAAFVRHRGDAPTDNE